MSEREIDPDLETAFDDWVDDDAAEDDFAVPDEDIEESQGSDPEDVEEAAENEAGCNKADDSGDEGARPCKARSEDFEYNPDEMESDFEAEGGGSLKESEDGDLGILETSDMGVPKTGDSETGTSLSGRRILHALRRGGVPPTLLPHKPTRAEPTPSHPAALLAAQLEKQPGSLGAADSPAVKTAFKKPGQRKASCVQGNQQGGGLGVPGSNRSKGGEGEGVGGVPGASKEEGGEQDVGGAEEAGGKKVDGDTAMQGGADMQGMEGVEGNGVLEKEAESTKDLSGHAEEAVGKGEDMVQPEQRVEVSASDTAMAEAGTATEAARAAGTASGAANRTASASAVAAAAKAPSAKATMAGVGARTDAAIGTRASLQAGKASESRAAASSRASAPCSHPSYWAGICVVCGESKPEDTAARPFSYQGNGGSGLREGREGGGGKRARGDNGLDERGGGTGRDGENGEGGRGAEAATTQLRHLHPRGVFEVGAAEAERMRKWEVQHLRGVKKLVLILDLDHTLLNSVRMTDVTPDHARLLESMLVSKADQPRRLLHCLRDKNLWTKLRPFVFEFLDACQPLFQLHIYTMGDRAYAAEVRKLLDPERKLFKSVISQNDSTSISAKNLDVAMADSSVVLIVDDTEHVWPHHGQNLLQIDRYHYFPASCRQFGSDGGSLLEKMRDESQSEGSLSTCLKVLQDVHRQFFEEESEGQPSTGGLCWGSEARVPLEKRDVRYYLSRRREEILQGCVLVFSHCWPQTYPKAHSHPLWQMAEKMGAEIVMAYDSGTVSHVVAGAPGTAKAHAALEDGRHVVSPDWLQACMFRWTRVDESKFPPVDRSKVAKRPPVSQSRAAPTQLPGAGATAPPTAAPQVPANPDPPSAGLSDSFAPTLEGCVTPAGVVSVDAARLNGADDAVDGAKGGSAEPLSAAPV